MRLSPQRKRNPRISFAYPVAAEAPNGATPRSPKQGATPLCSSMQERPLDDTGVAVNLLIAALLMVANLYPRSARPRQKSRMLGTKTGQATCEPEQTLGQTVLLIAPRQLPMRTSNLRARIGSWHDISRGRLRQPLQHDSYHRKLRKTAGDHGESLVVGHQTAIASQPRECALDCPAATQTLNPPSLSVRLTISSSTGNPTRALASFGPA